MDMSTQTSEMKDWPIELRANAAAIELAPALYRAHCQVFGPADAEPFDQLPPSRRRQFIERAAIRLKKATPLSDQELAGELKACAASTWSRAKARMDQDRDAAMRRVLTDGACRILKVKETRFGDAIAEVLTDLGESLPIFSPLVEAAVRL